MSKQKYEALVKKHRGHVYGKTTQGRFIHKYNYNLQYKKGRLHSFFYHDLLVNTQETDNKLNSMGVCWGFVCALYLTLQEFSNKEEAIENFATQLDSASKNLGGRAKSLQEALTYEKDSKIIPFDFKKTLGLDCIKNKTVRYPNEKDKSFGKEKIIKFLLKRRENDFSEIITVPVKIIKSWRSYFNPAYSIFDTPVACNSHVCSFGKFRNKDDGKLIYVFYDPNEVPTVFYDEKDATNFLSDYLEELACIHLRYAKANYLCFELKTYAVDDQYGVKLKKIREKLVKQRKKSSVGYEVLGDIFDKINDAMDGVDAIYSSRFDRGGVFSHKMLLKSLIEFITSKIKNMKNEEQKCSFDYEKTYISSNLEFLQSLVSEIEQIKACYGDHGGDYVENEQGGSSSIEDIGEKSIQCVRAIENEQGSSSMRKDEENIQYNHSVPKLAEFYKHLSQELNYKVIKKELHNSCFSKVEILNIINSINVLQKEIYGFWPYPNTDIKKAKVKGLTFLLIRSTQKASKVEVIKEAEDEFPDMIKGSVSDRTHRMLSQLAVGNRL